MTIDGDIQKILDGSPEIVRNVGEVAQEKFSWPPLREVLHDRHAHRLAKRYKITNFQANVVMLVAEHGTEYTKDEIFNRLRGNPGVSQDLKDRLDDPAFNAVVDIVVQAGMRTGLAKLIQVARTWFTPRPVPVTPNARHPVHNQVLADQGLGGSQGSGQVNPDGQTQSGGKPADPLLVVAGRKILAFFTGNVIRLKRRNRARLVVLGCLLMIAGWFQPWYVLQDALAAAHYQDGVEWTYDIKALLAIPRAAAALAISYGAYKVFITLGVLGLLMWLSDYLPSKRAFGRVTQKTFDLLTGACALVIVIAIAWRAPQAATPAMLASIGKPTTPGTPTAISGAGPHSFPLGYSDGLVLIAIGVLLASFAVFAANSRKGLLTAPRESPAAHVLTGLGKLGILGCVIFTAGAFATVWK